LALQTIRIIAKTCINSFLCQETIYDIDKDDMLVAIRNVVGICHYASVCHYCE